MNKHKDIEAANPDFVTSAEEIATEFETNKDSANEKYNAKVIEFSGVVQEVLLDDSVSSVVLKANENYTITAEVLANHNDKTKTIKINDLVTVKGLYIGFMAADPDMGLPGDIKFKKCSFNPEKK